MKAGLEAALEVVGAEVHRPGQLGQGDGAGEVRLHIVDGAAQRMGCFARGRQGPGVGAQGFAHAQQQAVGGELTVTVPEGVQGRLQDGGGVRVASHCLGEIPAALAADGLEPIGGQVEHAIAPPLLAGSLARVQFIGVHQHQAARARQELAATIAKTLGATLDDTEAKPLVAMGIEGVVLDVGAVELGRRLARQGAKIGPVVLMGKCDRYSLHPDLLSLSLHHKVLRGGGQD